MKELLIKILESHGSKIFPFLVGLLCMFVFFFFTDLLRDEIKKKNLQEEVVKPAVVTVSTAKSKKFIECIYDQLECYNKNVGLTKEVVLEACRDLDYCDGEKK